MTETPAAHAEERPIHARRPASRPARVALNVTSMVDILFNLLVYFIVTAAVIADEGAIHASLPGIHAVQPSPDEPLGEPRVIDLRAVNGVQCALAFERQALPDFDALHRRLVERRQSGALNAATDRIEIRPEAGVRWQHVVNAFNQAVRAGCTRVSFAPVAAAGR